MIENRLETATTLARKLGVSPSTVRRLDPMLRPETLPNGTRTYTEKQKRLAKALLSAK